MSLIGCKVRHKAFGIGSIISADASHVEVEFVNKTAKFVYPDAFEKFLKAEDEQLQNNIRKCIEDKWVQEEIRKAEALQKQLEKQEAKMQTVRNKKNNIPAKKEYKRPEGKNATYYVFQGKTFDKEFEGGYLWAPISNSVGFVPHHWERLVEVQPGDIIFHGRNGQVVAISVAKAKCYECDQLKELETEEAWGVKGRKLECDYNILKHPVKTALFKDDIIRLNAAKYSPFDKDGNGNMGYLFDLNRELAHVFVDEAVKKNAYILDEGYIRGFVNEL